MGLEGRSNFWRIGGMLWIGMSWRTMRSWSHLRRRGSKGARDLGVGLDEEGAR